MFDAFKTSEKFIYGGGLMIVLAGMLKGVSLFLSEPRLIIAADSFGTVGVGMCALGYSFKSSDK